MLFLVLFIKLLVALFLAASKFYDNFINIVIYIYTDYLQLG